MDITLSADQEFFRDTTRKFLEAETPLSARRALESDDAALDRDWWKRGAELGWTSMLVAEEHGGGSLAGEGLLDLVLVAEEMGRIVAPGALVPTNIVATALSDAGSAEHTALLPAIVSGDSIPAWAHYEHGHTWNPDDIEMRAGAAADEFVLNGTKSLVEAGHVADQFLVTARAAGGLTQFLVAASTPGLTVTNEPSLDLARRYATIDFDGVRVPTGAVVGEIGDAADALQHQLQVATVLQIAETTGAASRVFEFTLEYMADRFSFGRPLSSYQALKHRVADMKMWLEASLALATAAARAVQHSSEDAATVVSAAKSYVGEKATDIIQDCVQLHGGIGVTWEHDLHLYLRRATVNRFMYGTPEEHREHLAARAGI